jgi:polyhydroxyalkanoate synthesis regulator phasin
MEARMKLKVAVGAGAALVLAVALGAAGAVAADRVLSGDDEKQAVIDDAAAELGVEPGELSDALRKALANRVDEAVDDGRLTEEQGERLKERIESSDVPLFFPGLGGGRLHDRGFFDHGGAGRFGFGLDVDAAASYLGLTAAELMDELADGKTLAEIAREEGKSVDGLVEELVEAVEERIDDAVEDGRLSQERAARLKQSLEERVRERVNDELRPRGFRFGHKFGFDQRFERQRD